MHDNFIRVLYWTQVVISNNQYSIKYTGSKTWPQYVQPPVIPGHEFVGEVVKLGEGMYIHV